MTIPKIFYEMQGIRDEIKKDIETIQKKIDSKDLEMEQYMAGLHKDVTNFVNKKKTEKNLT